jgi:hypothetical protein
MAEKSKKNFVYLPKKSMMLIIQICGLVSNTGDSSDMMMMLLVKKKKAALVCYVNETDGQGFFCIFLVFLQIPFSSFFI